MRKCSICVENAVDPGNTSGQLVVPDGSLYRNSQQKSQEGITHRGHESKDQGSARGMAGDDDIGIDERVECSENDGEEERNHQE